MTTHLTVTRIKLPLANAYLVQGERPILVDTGAPGDTDRIVQALAKMNVQPADLALILLTHGHGDHVGAANELAALSGAPVALHHADEAMARAGRNTLGTLTSLEARMIAPFVDKPFAPVTASILLDAPLDLRPYGVAGEVIATPGHTAGSVSIFFDNGDAIVGDLLMGGWAAHCGHRSQGFTILWAISHNWRRVWRPCWHAAHSACWSDMAARWRQRVCAHGGSAIHYGVGRLLFRRREHTSHTARKERPHLRQGWDADACAVPGATERAGCAGKA